MPAAPPKPKPRSLSRAGVRLQIRLGDVDGSTPTADDEVTYLMPTRMELSATGGRVTTAVFDFDLGELNQHIVDTLAPKGVTRQIEVREVDVFGDFKRILCWGKLAAQPVEIGETERIQFVARIDKHLFGQPLSGTPFWSPRHNQQLLLDRPLVFNPEIDEVILGNKSDKQWVTRNNAFVFFDVASVNNQAARTYHGQTPINWTIYEAVHVLCWLCNPDETYIKNPTATDCYIALSKMDPTRDLLKNVHIHRDRYLPQLLDELLTPYGASWTVDFTTDPATGNSVRKIRLFRRNFGTPKQLYLQRPGDKLDTAKSNVPQLSINYDVSNLANVVVGRTSRKQREGTFELVWAWPATEDSLERDAILTDADTKKLHPHAYHKFVLNESGAYIGLRTEITAIKDLTSHFDGDATLPTCRKFLPCLSRVIDDQSSADKLESRGIVVEWLDPGDSLWKTVDWGVSNLQQECGVWFDGVDQKFYDAIQQYNTQVKVRVTATIEGDLCTYSTAARLDESPNGDEIILPLNLGDKFHDKLLASSSIYKTLNVADTADDKSRLSTYVTQIRAIEDSADLACSAILEGIDHPEYQIGDLITSVNGRNLKLNRNNASLLSPEKYLQVMGFTLNLPPGEDAKPQTELLLESFDEEQI
jgi:hypothetical protein